MGVALITTDLLHWMHRIARPLPALAAGLITVLGIVVGNMGTASAAVALPNDRTAFVKAGDLYSASSCGGQARAYDVYTANASNGGNQQKIYNSIKNNYADLCGGPRELSISPDRTKIAMVELNELRILSFDGNHTWARYSLGCKYPSWSPDGSKIACTRPAINGTMTGDIKIFDAATGNQVHYIGFGDPYNNNRKALHAAEWLPDGNGFIVTGKMNSFNCDPYIINGGIFKINMAGNITSSLKSDSCSNNSTTINRGYVRLSANGSLIAYTESKTGVPGTSIRTVNLDGSNDKLVIAGLTLDYRHTFSWSNDSQELIASISEHSDSSSSSKLVRIHIASGAILTIASGDQYAYASPTSGQSSQPFDAVAPNVNGQISIPPNSHGWHKADMTIDWTATDPAPSSGVPSQPLSTIANQEGTHTYISGQSCDPANNCATGSLEIKLDKTKPTISYLLSTPPNENGWTADDVTVTFACTDTLSGVDTCSAPVNLSEGANQTVTGTAKDKAGNTSSIDVVLNIDKTKPTIAYVVTPEQNTLGWNSADALVTFSCLDSLSGVATCTEPQTVSNEGTVNQVTGTAVDNAGNSASITASVKIDKTLPEISYQLNSNASVSDWNKEDVIVTFTCSDSLSGIESCPEPKIVGEGDNQTVTGIAVDKASNSKRVEVVLKVDKSLPTISYSVSPDATVNGWSTSDVIVTFTCADALSDIRSCTPPQTVSSDGSQQVVGTATDNAGNTITTTATVKVDKTAPSITAQLSGTPTADGWYDGAVTVSFVCTDAASSVSACSDPVTVTDNGASIITGEVTDNAGHSSSVNVIVQVDDSNPTVQQSVSPVANAAGWHKSDVTVTTTCQDGISGIISCSLPQTISTEAANHNVTSTAVDKAGNTAQASTVLKIDKTAPALGTVTWTTNPKSTTSISTVTIASNDSLSGVAGGEYFIGTDPGTGNGATMTRSAGNLVTTFGTDFVPGVYDIGFRTVDAAGNWSLATKTMLVVFDPAGVGTTGKNKKDLVPKLANGDIMPGLVSTNQSDAVDYGFTVDYLNGAMDTRNDFHLSYRTGAKNCTPPTNGCHNFFLNADSFSWLVVDQTNNSRARYESVATVTVDGVVTTNPFTVTAIDGDRINGTTSDSLNFQVFAPGSNPNSATPLYKINGIVTKVSGVKNR